MHTCFPTEEKECELISKDTDHIFKNVSTYFFHQSFTYSPAIASDTDTPNTTKIKWTHPELDFTIFQKGKTHTATFKKATPTDLFKELAEVAETKFVEINKVVTNKKRYTFFFYQYFKAFLEAAALNDEITNLSLDQATRKIITKSTDIHFLARIISYFDIIQQPKISVLEIRKNYKISYYPQAEKLFILKYNFQTPPAIKEDIFFKPQPTNPSF
jgi:hypothetical protein